MGEKCWLEKEREVWVWSRQVSVHSIPIVDMPLNCVTSFSYSAVIIMEQSAVLICLLCNLYQSDRHYWCAPVAWLPSWSIHFHTRFHDLASLSLVNVNPPSPSARYDHSLSGDLLLPHFLAYTWALETHKCHEGYICFMKNFSSNICPISRRTQDTVHVVGQTQLISS